MPRYPSCPTCHRLLHFSNNKNGEIEKLAVAAHVWKEKYAMDRKPILLKQRSHYTF
jgi:hypothetical protein